MNELVQIFRVGIKVKRWNIYISACKISIPTLSAIASIKEVKLKMWRELWIIFKSIKNLLITWR